MKSKKALHPDAPLYYADHRKPVSRRDFLACGLGVGSAILTGGSVLSLFAAPNRAHAALSADLEALKKQCGIAVQGAGKIPFICFDLAGGANIAGSNVLVGGAGGQLDFLSTQGYSKLGLPADMVPGAANSADPANGFINKQLGLAFHSDSAMLRGILNRAGTATQANTNGAVIATQSEMTPAIIRTIRCMRSPSQAQMAPCCV